MFSALGRGSTASAGFIAATLLAASLLAIGLCRWPLRAIRWPAAFVHRQPGLLLCLCAAVGTAAAIFGMNLASELLSLPDYTQVQALQLATLPAGMLCIAVIAPLAEEIVFREATLGTMLRDGIRPWVAIGFSGLLFGVAHLNPAQVPFATVLGIILGIIYYRTGNLLLCSLLHMANNSLAVFQFNLMGPAALDFSLVEWVGGTRMAAVCIAACTLLSIVFLSLFWKKNYTPNARGRHCLTTCLRHRG